MFSENEIFRVDYKVCRIDASYLESLASGLESAGTGGGLSMALHFIYGRWRIPFRYPPYSDGASEFNWLLCPAFEFVFASGPMMTPCSLDFGHAWLRASFLTLAGSLGDS